ncbi:hypothetical protein LCGC14_1731140 [marine sediment metagenome]|uniref:Uncharacterized protein n=1 Tax=marine sediment metagenome TaxID=412755 RepID=A0A0F9H9B5_9ZZZZ
MDAAEGILRGSHDHHFHVVYDHLLGKKTAFGQLWLSTGYFFYGIGVHSTMKPWKNEEQRKQLLQDTGREEK